MVVASTAWLGSWDIEAMMWGEGVMSPCPKRPTPAPPHMHPPPLRYHSIENKDACTMCSG